MINQNELRIGNILNFAFKESDPISIVTVDTIYREDLGYTHEDGTGKMPLKYFSGIPLSLEWLERMGFKESVFTIGLGNIRGFFSAANGGSAVCLRDMNSNTQSRYLTTVHDIQNLYYALTGKEIPIQL
jgi:hypothetical protein